MKYNGDFKHDLEVGQVKEKELANIFEGSTIEVKRDLKAFKTGNVFVEYYNLRSKTKSGISTTEAEFYCFAIENSFHIIKTSVLKEKCRKYIGTKKDVLGGDSNTSKGILLKIQELI
tara:strand:+ start:789 stop:1139 length:351 start_codon:yes stop_codon:yes gene_type:complete